MRKVPLNSFGIPFGLLGLADCWLVAGEFSLAPIGIGYGITGLATVAWLAVLGAYVLYLRSSGTRFAAEVADAVAGPFASLIVIVPMLAAADGLYPISHAAGATVVDVLAAAAVLCGGLFVGEWIYNPPGLKAIHPGYFLPSVAGSFVAAASAALVGQDDFARLLFGVGLISWLVIGSIVLGRLVAGPPLPDPLVPTLAIEVAPAAVATFAAFVIEGGQIGLAVKLLAAYGVLMIAAQVRLLSLFLRLRFMPSFWAFTFAWAAVVVAGMFRLEAGRPVWWKGEEYVLLAAITVLVGAISLRTLIALARGEFLPAASGRKDPPDQQVPAAAEESEAAVR